MQIIHSYPKDRKCKSLGRREGCKSWRHGGIWGGSSSIGWWHM